MQRHSFHLILTRSLSLSHSHYIAYLFRISFGLHLPMYSRKCTLTFPYWATGVLQKFLTLLLRMCMHATNANASFCSMNCSLIIHTHCKWNAIHIQYGAYSLKPLVHVLMALANVVLNSRALHDISVLGLHYYSMWACMCGDPHRTAESECRTYVCKCVE